MNPYDLNVIEHQRIFIVQAIDYYTRQINNRREILVQLKMHGGGDLMNLERNINFMQYMVNQYQQMLECLRQMWYVYINQGVQMPN